MTVDLCSIQSAGDQVILNQRHRLQDDSQVNCSQNIRSSYYSFHSRMLYSVPLKNLYSAYPVDIVFMKLPGSFCHSILND